jgi:hypothetical protein
MKRSMTLAALLLCTAFGAARAQQTYEPPATAADRALAERRQQMIDECQQNHGSEIDCKREADTELRAEGLQSGARVIRLRPAR